MKKDNLAETSVSSLIYANEVTIGTAQLRWKCYRISATEYWVHSPNCCWVSQFLLFFLRVGPIILE